MCYVTRKRLHFTSEFFDHGEYERSSSPREPTLGGYRSGGACVGLRSPQQQS